MNRRSDIALVVLRVLVLSLLLTLLGRLFVLQIAAGEQYSAAATENRTREVFTNPVRGLILDQQGRPLVSNRTSMVVSLDRSVLERLPDSGSLVIDRVSSLLGVSPQHVQERIKLCGTEGAKPPPVCWNGSPYQPIPIAQDVAVNVALVIMENQNDYPGVTAELSAIRQYPAPFGVNAAHTLGYLGPVNNEELQEQQEKGVEPGVANLRQTDLIGRAGLEAVYDADLRGAPGVKTLAVDRAGLVTGVVSTTDPKPGNYLVTHIDARLQSAVEQELLAAVARSRAAGQVADSAAAVVMDAKTGAVYAIASYPSYDPSVWIGGISERQFRWLANEKNGVPLISRVIQGMFPPASTFKVITAAAAAGAGFSLESIYQCPSTFRVGDRDFGNFGLASYGAITMQKAMEVSCDTVFYEIAYKLWLRDGGQEPEGPVSDDIENMSRAFGLGKRTGIDLFEEVAGRVGGREFRQKNWEQNKEIWCKRARDGYPEIADTDLAKAQLLQAYAVENCDHGFLLRGGDAVNLSIGQGDTVATPLQMAVVYAALANGGRVVKPHLGKAIVSSTGEVVRKIEPEPVSKLPVPRKTIKYLQDSLPGVITRGTATGAFAGFPNDLVPVAGKTGTGEVVGKGDTAWFVGYSPVADSRYVVVVAISQGGTGGAYAAPAVRGILEAIYGIQGGAVDPTVSAFIGGAPANALPQIRKDGQVVPPTSDATYQPPKPRLPLSADSGLPLIALPQLVSSPRTNQEQKKPVASETAAD